MQVTAEDINYVARLVGELCGVVLDSSKGYLVESRLGQLAVDEGCQTYRELCQRARAGSNKALQQKIIDAITTQETLFFRDNSPYEALQHKILPDLIDICNRAGHKRMRLWSAASSTGQEAYSMAMIIRETLPNFSQWNVSILATDICETAIATASRGWYAAHEIDRGMRASLLAKHFTAKDKGWQINDELRAMVSFQRRNLLQSFNELGMFDVILCRNVAIYFDPKPRRDLFIRLAQRLTAPCVLMTGASESLLDVGPNFLPQCHCRTTYYQPNCSAPTLAPRLVR